MKRVLAGQAFWLLCRDWQSERRSDESSSPDAQERISERTITNWIMASSMKTEN